MNLATYDSVDFWCGIWMFPAIILGFVILILAIVWLNYLVEDRKTPPSEVNIPLLILVGVLTLTTVPLTIIGTKARARVDAFNMVPLTSLHSVELSRETCSRIDNRQLYFIRNSEVITSDLSEWDMIMLTDEEDSYTAVISFDNGDLYKTYEILYLSEADYDKVTSN